MSTIIMALISLFSSEIIFLIHINILGLRYSLAQEEVYSQVSRLLQNRKYKTL